MKYLWVFQKAAQHLHKQFVLQDVVHPPRVHYIKSRFSPEREVGATVELEEGLKEMNVKIWINSHSGKDCV